MASNLKAMASNLLAMASNLLAMPRKKIQLMYMKVDSEGLVQGLVLICPDSL